jgi:hypothetical protein
MKTVVSYMSQGVVGDSLCMVVHVQIFLLKYTVFRRATWWTLGDIHANLHDTEWFKSDTVFVIITGVSIVRSSGM